MRKKSKIPTGELWDIRSEAKRRFAEAKRGFAKSKRKCQLRSAVAGIAAWLREQRKRTQYASQRETIDSLISEFEVRTEVLTGH